MDQGLGLLHHRPDHDVDIYLNGKYLVTRQSLVPDWPNRIVIGDRSSSTAVQMKLDHVRIGAPVHEATE